MEMTVYDPKSLCAFCRSPFGNLSASARRPSPDWERLEQRPNKLLIHYIHLMQQPLEESALAKKVQQSTQQICFEELTRLFNENKLSNYHCVKFLCHCTSKAKEHKELFQTKLNEFLTKEFMEDHLGEERKHIGRVQKIELLVKKNTTLNELLSPHFFEQKIKDAAGNEHLYNRFLWAKAVPAYRARLLGLWKKDEPIESNISGHDLEIIDRVSNGGRVWQGAVDADDIISLYKTADSLLMEELREKCADLFKHHVHEGSILKLLVFSLEQGNPELIHQFYIAAKNMIPNMQLQWDKRGGLSLKLNTLDDENIRAFLDALDPYVNCVELTTKSVVKQIIDKNILFRNTKTLISGNGIFISREEMEKLGRQFPETQKLILTETSYNSLTDNEEDLYDNSFTSDPVDPLETWDNLQILHLTEGFLSSKWKKIFPNLLLCLSERLMDTSFSVYEQQDVLFIRGTELKSVKELDLKNSPNIVCDDVVEQVAVEFPLLQLLDLSGCSRVTASKVKEIQKLLPKCKIIFESDIP